MQYIGTRTVGVDLPDGVYLEYAQFDCGKNIWITNKIGNKDHLYLFITGNIYITNEYYSKYNIIKAKRRDYGYLRVTKYNPPKCLDVIDWVDNVKTPPDRVLYKLEDAEVALHLFSGLV